MSQNISIDITFIEDSNVGFDNFQKYFKKKFL